MKKILFLGAVVFLLWGCGKESSPEGRMTMKVEDLQKQLDSLKIQNTAILDSLERINNILRAEKK